MKKITKQNIINLLKGVLILALAVAIVVGCSNILTLKSEDGISQFKSFYKQEEDSIDVLFMGSSHTYCNISTGVIWDNYGIPSFNLGGAEAPTWTSYFQMKEALKYQHPKVMAFEVSTAAIRPSLDPPEFWIEDNDYGMKWNSNRIDLLKVQTNDWLFKRIVFPLDTMHQRYSELTADDFIDKNNSINYKGYDYRDADPSYEVADVSGITEATAVTERSEEYLRKIIELCKSEGVELWFFITPYAITEDDQKIYNYIENIAIEEGIPYVNLNDPEYIKAMDFDFSCNLADELHVNIAGSEKLSDFLGSYLKEKYDLPDRRGDDKYSSWDVDARTLRMERADVALSKASSDKEFVEILDEDNYMIFITIDGNVSKRNIPDGVMPALVNLGVSLEEIKGGNTIILQSGQVIFSQVLDEYKVTAQNGYDNLLFERVKSDDSGKAYDTILNLNGMEYVFENNGIEIYAYDLSNSVMAGNRHIICEQ